MARLYPNVWGIFADDGVTSMLDVDTITAFHYTDDGKVSDFPVEKGSFATYNKVETPYQARVKVSVGGDSVLIARVLAQLRFLKQDTTALYHIVTPEIIYIGATVVKFDYSREAKNGSNSIHANLTIKEVREVVPQYASVSLQATKKPQSKSKKDTGKGQAGPPPVDLKDYSASDIIALHANGWKPGQVPPDTTFAKSH